MERPAAPNKKTTVQDYEDFRSLIEWNSWFRNDDIIPFQDYLNAYKKHPTVVACIQFIADKAVMLGWELVAAPGVDDPDMAQRAQVLEVLNNIDPDGNYTFVEVLYSVACNVLRDGMGFLQIDKVYPYLYELQTGTLKPRLQTNGLFKRDGKGQWEQIIEGSVRATLMDYELVWFRLADKTELIYPQSPLQPLLVGVETDLFGREFGKNRFTNAATFGNVFVMPEGTTDSLAKKFLAYLKAEYVSSKTEFGSLGTTGGKPLVLYGGSKLDSTALKAMATDVDFLALRSVTDKDICRVYKIPYRLVLDEEAGLGQAGANASALNQVYQGTIWPFQNLLTTQFNKQFLQRRLSCTDWVLKLTRPLAPDSEEVSRRLRMVETGIETPREARKGLREYFPELQESLDDLFPDVPTPKGVSNPFEGMFGAPAQEPPAEQKSLVVAYTTRKKPVDVPIKAWDSRAVATLLDAKETTVHDKLKEILDKMKAAATKELIVAANNKDFKAVSGFGLKYKNEVTNLFTTTGESLFESGRKFVTKMTKASKAVNLSPAKYFEYVKLTAKTAATQYVLNLEDKIKTLVLDAIARKKSDNFIVGAIEERFNKSLGASDVVVRTLNTNFYNKGIAAEVYAVGQDFVPNMQYSAILDDRTSDRCESLQGVIVAVNSEEYERIMPPQHFNCRSMMIPITVIDIEKDPAYGVTAKPKDISKILADTGGFEND